MKGNQLDTSATKSGSDSTTKSLLLRGAMRFMQPIARLMLKMGVTHAEFAELCKTVFVHVAASDFGIRGRRANNSRIAILTGLGRKQVSYQVALLEGEQIAEPAQMSPATRLITAWSKDPEFVAADGSPRDLPVSGEGTTFATLSERYAGDLPHSALLKELLRVGAVKETADSRLTLTSRSFLATELDPDHIRILTTQLQGSGRHDRPQLRPANGRDPATAAFRGRQRQAAAAPRERVSGAGQP